MISGFLCKPKTTFTTKHIKILENEGVKIYQHLVCSDTAVLFCSICQAVIVRLSCKGRSSPFPSMEDCQGHIRRPLIPSHWQHFSFEDFRPFKVSFVMNFVHCHLCMYVLCEHLCEGVSSTLPHCCETRSLIEPGVSPQSTRPHAPPVSAPHSSGVTGTSEATTSFLCLCWGFELRSCACTLNALIHSATFPAPCFHFQ